MGIVTSSLGSATLLTVDGRVTMGPSSSALRTAVQQLVEQGAKEIVLDLGGVSYVDSAGLGTLAASAAQTKAAGLVLLLANLQPRVREAVRMVGLDRALSLWPTLDAAILALKADPPSALPERP